ncbi:hypothetical protein [Companilactobacillus zhachilii]|uniref:hypothetical protein n=1 Tax=Companilactobacillus zhachilii TaxID=2304606 RepID=UPI0040333FA8
MVENAITKVARIAAHAAQGLVYKDSAGKEQTILPTGDKNMIDISGLSIGNGSGGNTSGGDNPNPNAGADYFAGSLANGEITDRDLLVQISNDNPTNSNKVTFVQDVGTKVNKVGDGITIIGYIQKTIVTKGVVGTVSRLDLNYDPNNAVKDGCFTTTSPYPIYINQQDIVVGKKLEVPINGIGENLSGKNVQPAKLFITFSDDNTALIEHEAGFDNDGGSTGATGANYQFIVEAIATFSVQTAVAQLPTSVSLFSGSSNTDVALSGITNYFEDSMDGIEITFDNYIYQDPQRSFLSRATTSSFTSTHGIKIPKEYLINGYAYDISRMVTGEIATSADDNHKLRIEKWESNSWQSASDGYYYGYRGVVTPTIVINKAGITNKLKINIQYYTNAASSGNGKASWSENDPWYWAINKVTPYKN